MEKEKFSKIKNIFKTHKKTVWISGAILIIIVLLAVVILPFFNRNQDGSAMEIVTVSRGSITETVDSYGTLEAQPSITLTWNSDGVVGDYDLNVGDEVQKDDVLMELDASSQSPVILEAKTSILDTQEELEKLTVADTEFQSVLDDLIYQEKMLINKHADKLAWNYGQSSEERIDAVRANYEAAEREVWELEGAYDKVKSLDEDDPERVAANEALQEGILKRDSLLRALNQILGIPFDIAVETDFIEYDQQNAVVAEARVAYNRYVNQSDEINAAQAAVQILQNTINEAKIIAPFDGTVTSISAVTGDLVTSGTEAVRIDNLDNLVVNVTIPQAEINKVEVGQEAILTFDAISVKEYSGFVQSISEAGIANDNGVVQFTVVIKMEDTDDQVKPGFTTVVTIITSKVEDTLLIPNQAVTTSEDGTSVVTLISDDGSITTIPVETGASSDVYTEIVSGDIEESDQLAVITIDSGSTSGRSPMIGIGGGLLRGIFGGGGR